MVDALNRESGRGSVASGLKKLVGRGDGGDDEAFQTMAVDTDRSSLKKLKHTLGKDRMHLATSFDSREAGKKYFRDVEGRVLRSIDERGQFDIVVMFVGGGGFTGSAFAALLADRLAEVTESVVYCVMTLPFQSEGDASLRTVRAMRELWESSAECILLVDNPFLATSESSGEFKEINRKVARKVHRLFTDVERGMVTVADLGDLKSTLRGGNKIGTLGMVEGLRCSVDEAIRRSFSREGTLFPVDIYNEGARALVIMEGPKSLLQMEELRSELGNLSEQLFNVFKGVMIRDGGGVDVLSVVSLSRSERLEEFISNATKGASISLEEIEEY